MFKKFLTKLNLASLVFYFTFLPINPNLWSGIYKDTTNRNFDETIGSLSDQVENRWFLTMSPYDWVGTSPVYFDDLVYFGGGKSGSYGQSIYAYNKDTGNLVWQVQIPRQSISQVLASSQGILVLSENEIYFLDSKNGQTLFSIKDTGNLNFYRPVWYGDTIFAYGTNSSNMPVTHIYKISFSERKIVWKIENSTGAWVGLPVPISENEIITSEMNSTTNTLKIEDITAAQGNCKTGYCKVTKGSYLRQEAGAAISRDEIISLDNNLYARRLTVGKLIILDFNDIANGVSSNAFVLKEYTDYMLSGLVANGEGLYVLEKGSETDTQIILHKFIINKTNVDDGGATPIQGVTFSNPELPLIKPVISNKHLFVPKEDKQVYYQGKYQYRWYIEALDLNTGMIKSYPQYYSSNQFHPQQLLHFDGVFVAKVGNNAYQACSISGYSKITIASPYINDSSYHEYLGQIHAHYIPDIGDQTKASAASVVQKYKNAGYDFIALTEHNQLTPSPTVGGITYINMAEEDTQGYGGNHILALGIHNSINENSSEQDRISSIYNQGGFSSLAHPNEIAYQWPMQKLISTYSYNAIEIFNNAVDKMGKYYDLYMRDMFFFDNGYALNKWDDLLSKGKKVYATAGDDFTPGYLDIDFNGGGVVVLSQNSAETNILSNLKSGNYYVVQGSKSPRIKVETTENLIKASSNKNSSIRFIGKNGKVLQRNDNVVSATYEPKGDERYVRAEVVSYIDDGSADLKSWSQPIFVNNGSVYFANQAGSKTLTDDTATLSANTTSPISIQKITPRGSTLPPNGLISPVYKVEANKNSGEEAIISIDYSGENLTTSEDSLKIYKHNESDDTWNEIDSTVDPGKKTVDAPVDDGEYVLSSDEISDTLPPTLELLNESELSNITGQAKVKMRVGDNSKVYEVKAILDDKAIIWDETNIPTTGYLEKTIDFSMYNTGSHKLAFTAIDTFGNEIKKLININIMSVVTIPRVDILTNSLSTDFCQTFEINGQGFNDITAKNAQIYEDNVLLGQISLKYGRSGFLFNRPGKSCYYIIERGINNIGTTRSTDIIVNKVGFSKGKYYSKSKNIEYKNFYLINQ